MKYYANGLTFKLEQEEDGWWSIYRLNEYIGKYIPQLQAKDLEHAQNYCDMQEPTLIPLERLVER